MNLALKQILDRYSACTLDLETAEAEIRDCLFVPIAYESEDGIAIKISEFVHYPDSVAVLSLDRSVPQWQLDHIRRQWERFHEGHKAAVLQPGMTVTKELASSGTTAGDTRAEHWGDDWKNEHSFPTRLIEEVGPSMPVPVRED